MTRIARWLRTLADRIDHEGAPKRTCWSLTFEDGKGAVFNQDGRGCPWYLGDESYERAHKEAGAAPTQPGRGRRSPTRLPRGT